MGEKGACRAGVCGAPLSNKEAIISLILMSFANLYIYLERYLPSSGKEHIKASMELSDFETGLIYTVFIASYAIFSPLAGFLVDHKIIKRKVLIVIGVLITGISTSAAYFCQHSYIGFLACRVLFGVGEAIFCTVGQPFITEFFVPTKRPLVLSIYLCFMSVGCAVGYIVAGSLCDAIGWPLTFLYIGAVCFVFVPIIFLREPVAGEKDAFDDSGEGKELLKPKYFEAEPKKTLCNAVYFFVLIGYIVNCFAMGAISDWLPTFFQRYDGMSSTKAGLVSGAIVVVSGILGNLCGSTLTVFTRTKVTKHYPTFLVSGVATVLCSACAFYVFYGPTALVSHIVSLFLGVYFGWFYNGPINALGMEALVPTLRATGVGTIILCIHVFGDAISPSLVGMLSDKLNNNLRLGLIVVPIAFGISGLVWLLGWIVLPRNSIGKGYAAVDPDAAPATESINNDAEATGEGETTEAK